jgi:hypothetical protein
MSPVFGMTGALTDHPAFRPDPERRRRERFPGSTVDPSRQRASVVRIIATAAEQAPKTGSSPATGATAPVPSKAPDANNRTPTHAPVSYPGGIRGGWFAGRSIAFVIRCAFLCGTVRKDRPSAEAGFQDEAQRRPVGGTAARADALPVGKGLGGSIARGLAGSCFGSLISARLKVCQDRQLTESRRMRS